MSLQTLQSAQNTAPSVIDLTQLYTAAFIKLLL